MSDDKPKSNGAAAYYGEAAAPLPQKPKRDVPLWRRILVRIVQAGIVLFLLFHLYALVLRLLPVPGTILMTQRAGQGEDVRKDWTSLDKISPHLVLAVIAAEDAKFCEHDGIDWEAIEKAREFNKRNKGERRRGGSTISQQTAKNVFLWQGSGWTRYLRKVPEVWFTFLIETIWGKRRIMEVYLNVAETGIGTYGVEAGAQRYFKHGANKLTPREAARIAAILPLPKKREAVSPSGFTRRYGNSIRARIGVVGRDGLDGCIYN